MTRGYVSLVLVILASILVGLVLADKQKATKEKIALIMLNLVSIVVNGTVVAIRLSV